jgi:imidazolonepropionase-like amidohydrolase
MIPGQEEGMKTIRAIVCCFLAISATASAQPQQGVLFTNVMVWDGTSEALRKADVLVTGNKISEVSDEPLAVIQSTDMMVIDGGGRTLMPGLIDAHVHLNMQFGGHATDRGIQGMQNLTWEEMGALAYESAREFLPAGVTTVRDLCGMSQGLRKHIDSGRSVATGRSPISSFSASPGLQTAQTTFSKPPATILPPVLTSPR